MIESSNPPSHQLANIHEQAQPLTQESYQFSKSYPSLNDGIQLHTYITPESRNANYYITDSLPSATIGVPIEFPRIIQAQQFIQKDSLPLQKSSLFQERDCLNKAKVILSIMFDVGFGIASALFLSKTCGYRRSGIQIWNLQWMIYFFTQTLYQILIFFQFFSKSLSNEVALKMGQLKTSDENTAYLRYFNTVMTIKMRNEYRNLLDKQYKSFYYQRNKFLKFLYVLQGFYTLTYLIYGYIELLVGTTNCSSKLIWFSFISVLSVSIVNLRAIKDLVTFTISVLLYIPTIIYIKSRNLSLYSGFIERFQTVSYVNGAVEGDNSCQICKNDYIFGEKITILPCHQLHHFHKTCIKAALEINPLCPHCRCYFSSDYQQTNSAYVWQQRV